MSEIMQYLPLLNVLVIPVFMAYMKVEIRLTKLEQHKERVEIELSFNDRRTNHG